MSRTLDYLRHAYKLKEKGLDGKTHIDLEKSEELIRQTGLALSNGPAVAFGFFGVEPRTKETLDPLLVAMGYQEHDPDISLVGYLDEIGGDDFAYGTLFVPEVMAIIAERKGTKAYLPILIEHHGIEKVRAWALYGLSGVVKMLDMMFEGDRGIAIGHSPDNLLLSYWAASGFPNIDELPGGGDNLAELTGGRFVFHDDRRLTVEPLLIKK